LRNLKFIPPDIHRKWKKSALEPGDVVIVRVGYPGTASVVPDGLGDLNAASLVIVRPDQAIMDARYLTYVLNSPFGKAVIQGLLVGSAQQVLNTGTVSSMEIPMPPLSTQRKIAAVLSAYDDLIENNNRRIQLLEEMAQRIYREWFVDFRYPGHERVPLVESQLGWIPVGWDTGSLKDLVDVNADTIRGSDTDEMIDYIDISSVERGTVTATKRMMLSDAPGRARRRLSDGDILWSTVRPNLCAYALVLAPNGNFVASTGFAVLSPRNAPFAYIYALSTTDAFVEYLNGRATGSAYPAVTSSIFENAPALLPPKDILEAFAENTEPNFLLASLLARKSSILRSTRDHLLPRLISGEIDVTDLDIAVLEVVA
jgi:type I restriction enzyme S subunit